MISLQQLIYKMKLNHGNLVYTWKNNLKNIHDYIAADSKFYAKKVSEEFIEKSERLEE